MRPIARLATELRLSAAGQLVVGAAGLVGALLRGVGPGRALVPFAIAFVVVGAVSLASSRWLRSAEAPAAADGVRVETASETARRTLVAISAPLLVVAFGIVFTGALAAVLGGVVAAVGAVDLLNMRRVRARERAQGQAIYRELGPSPFSSGRRPLFSRPA